MNFQEEFNDAFGERFPNLQLKSVVAKKSDASLVITFLYPSTDPELTTDEKREIVDMIKDKLELDRLDLKVKFMRVFLEERLILKVIQTFFEQKYKMVNAYLNDQSFKIEINNIDIIVEINLSPRMVEFFDRNKISPALARVLKDNFLVDFVINVHQCDDIIEEVDIVNVPIKTAYKPVQRYEVEIEKKITKTDMMTFPEYLSFIKSPKPSVVVAGYISKIERKDFVIKKGKRVGQQKAYFTFQIQDEKGKIDCLFFSAKCYEKDMDALEEYMYVLLHGDVKYNQMNKLCLYVDKIALAHKVEKKQVEEEEKKVVANFEHVVPIEKLTALEQDTMFEQKNKYSSKIMGKNIVVFDIETTGLDTNTAEIIELGAVKLENGNIVEKFSTFVKPTGRIPREVSELTGITEDMVENAPQVEYVIKDFYDFTRGCVLSGHNIIGYDLKIVRREAEKLGLDFDNELIDTLNEARVSKLKISKFNLGTVVKALGLTLEGAHRAWNDAYATAQVLLRLNEI